jgi:uncharacterized protein (TIRG00374 family)
MAGASLIFVRVFDVIALAFWALLLLPPLLNTTSSALANVYFPFVLIVLAISFYLVSRNDQMRENLIRLLEDRTFPPDESKGVLRRVLSFARNTAVHFLVMVKEAPSGRIFFMSITLWLFNFFYFYLVLQAFGQKVTFFQSVLPAYGATLGHLLPINTLGSLGTFESGMVLGQMGANSETATAIPVAFLTHAHVLITSASAGMVAWFYLKKKHE